MAQNYKVQENAEPRAVRGAYGAVKYDDVLPCVSGDQTLYSRNLF